MLGEYAIEAISLLRCLMKKKIYKKACEDLDMIFVGIKKAYDRVSKSLL